ncbi:hypothetical protein [Escherichia coli]|nr:hypothetical protein [Escherichia coli]BBR86871.1 hypothetical protein WP4S18E07_07670 [Escherichia coli]
MNTFDNVILNSEGYKNIIVNNKGVIIYIGEGYKDKKLVINFLGCDSVIKLGDNVNIQGGNYSFNKSQSNHRK